MPEDHPHRVLAQIPLTVSPFVSLPTATPLPYTYQQLPSTLPPSITDPPADAYDPNQPRDSFAIPAASSSSTVAYVTSASGKHAAHPDEIIDSCRALQEQLARLSKNARSTLQTWQNAIHERTLAEKRRMAPGWLDESIRMLVPERAGGHGQQPQQQQHQHQGHHTQDMVTSAELDRAFGNLNIRP